MSEKEARKFIDRVFAESPVIEEWRKRAREERERQVDLLRRAVIATFEAYNNGSSFKASDAAWKAYKESL
jgi:hypothetical protein